MRLELGPAGHGDCLMLRWEAGTESACLLVDGGPYNRYESLRAKLLSTAKRLRLVVATHVDADHVEGLVKLFQDDALSSSVDEVWFNGWQHLQALSGTLGPVAGEYLSTLLTRRSANWNGAFGGRAVVATSPAYPAIEFEGKLQLTVLAPGPTALRRLSRVWKRAVEKAGLAPGSNAATSARLQLSPRFRRNQLLGAADLSRLAQEAESTDDSIVNGSSIALLAEQGGHRILLAGDSPPAMLEQAIREWLTSRGESKLRVDAFKVAHHGSKGSITSSLLGLLDCANYLISTDGSYFGHPDEEAVARIIRHGGKNVVLHFNYRHPLERFWNDSQLQSAEGFTVRYPEKEDGIAFDCGAVPC